MMLAGSIFCIFQICAESNFSSNCDVLLPFCKTKSWFESKVNLYSNRTAHIFSPFGLIQMQKEVCHRLLIVYLCVCLQAKATSDTGHTPVRHPLSAVGGTAGSPRSHLSRSVSTEAGPAALDRKIHHFHPAGVAWQFPQQIHFLKWHLCINGNVCDNPVVEWCLFRFFLTVKSGEFRTSANFSDRLSSFAVTRIFGYKGGKF